MLPTRLRLAGLLLVILGATMVRASASYQANQASQDKIDRQHEICSIHHDYFLATGDATFPTIYQILGVAQDANDVAILLATGRWRQRQARLQPDRAAVVLEEGGRISAADLEPAHVITPMAAVLLDKRIRKVYDTYFVPTLSKKTAWGNSQRGKQFEKMCGEFIVRRG